VIFMCVRFIYIVGTVKKRGNAGGRPVDSAIPGAAFSLTYLHLQWIGAISEIAAKSMVQK